MPPDRDLERELRELGSHVEYPPTPNLARTVRRRLDGEGTGRPARSRTIWPSLPPSRWAVAAAILVLAVVAPLLSPAMRDTVNGWFEAGGAARSSQSAGGSPAIESKEDAAGAPSAARSEPMPGSGQGGRYLGEDLGFGERVTLGEARSRTDAPVLLPRAAGPGVPEVYAGDPREDGVTLVYRARPGLPPLGTTEVGLILTERVGGVETAYFPDATLPEAGFERVEVGDEPGYWAPAGRDVSSRSLGGSVLLWEQGELALRLEVDLPEEEAIRVAESVR